MKRKWAQVPFSAISFAEDADGNRVCAVVGFGGKARYHVSLLVDGRHYETWADDRDAGYAEIQKMRRGDPRPSSLGAA